MFRRFFSYYARYKRLFFLDFGCAILAGLLELGFPLAVKLFVDELLPGRDWGLIAAVAAALLAIYAINTALSAVVNYWGHALGISIESDMRRQAFDHIQKLSFRYFDNNKTGHLITHVTKDLEEVGEVAHHGPEDVFIAIMTFIGAFLLMFSVHWKLALITTAIVPFMTWLVSRYGAKMTVTWRNLFRKVGDFNTRVQESVGGIRVVKAFGNEGYESELFARNNEGYKETKLNAYAYMTASIALSYFSTRLVQLIIMVAGTWYVVSGELTYGGFVGFLLLVNVFFHPIDKITSVLEMYPKGIAGFKRFISLIEYRTGSRRPSRCDDGDVAARRYRLQGCLLRLLGRWHGLRTSEPEDIGGRNRCLRRSLGRGKDHHLLTAAALLRRNLRRHHH